MGAHGQSIYDGQVADNLVGKTVGEVIVGGILAQVGQGQNRDGDGRALVPNPPPAGGRRSDHNSSNSASNPRPPGTGFVLFTRPEWAKSRRITTLRQFDNHRIRDAFSLHNTQPTGLEGVQLRCVRLSPA